VEDQTFVLVAYLLPHHMTMFFDAGNFSIHDIDPIQIINNNEYDEWTLLVVLIECPGIRSSMMPSVHLLARTLRSQLLP